MSKGTDLVSKFIEAQLNPAKIQLQAPIVTHKHTTPALLKPEMETKEDSLEDRFLEIIEKKPRPRKVRQYIQDLIDAITAESD